MKESLASLDHDDLVDAALFLADNLFLKDQINRKAAMDRFASKSEQLFIPVQRGGRDRIHVFSRRPG
ncbi:hypothetical protein [Faecalibaculum rodentium]|uniref:hypothetical protein n=1 Tax=Faecalibaculum rodentium TaxID=1702221 RepID=UPI003F6732E3